PDGDPNTTDDVPDVINFSMDFGSGCSTYWNEEINMTEALGIVNIFAAGNRGPIAMTMGNPANWAEDSLTNFAVGSI
ncbi:MAG: hypothetical protein GWN00_21450, partial [Aliifodinibius sp.]|nr:hypothetical protein [Fodinibius sp.]NIY27277.1 hypothetical protein [Fodinibius sp.]